MITVAVNLADCSRPHHSEGSLLSPAVRLEARQIPRVFDHTPQVGLQLRLVPVLYHGQVVQDLQDEEQKDEELQLLTGLQCLRLCFCVRACGYLGSGQLAECVQQGLQGPVGHVALELLELLLGKHLHEVVDVQQDAIQVDAADGFRKEPDHTPQTLRGGKGVCVWGQIGAEGVGVEM